MKPVFWRGIAGAAAIGVVAVALATAPDPTGGPDDAPEARSSATAPPGAGADQTFEPVTPTTVAVNFDHRPSPPVAPGDIGNLTFTDVTEAAGVLAERLGRQVGTAEDMTGGAAVGDYDDDGHLDLYLPRIGRPNLLYRNNGDGTFTDVAEPAGVQGTDWITGYSGAVFADVDGDTDLDLLVLSVSGAQTLLYINAGDGTFTDQAIERGLSPAPDDQELIPPRRFSATFADWNGDGSLDLLVTDWYVAALSRSLNQPHDEAAGKLGHALGNDQCARARLVEMGGHAPAPGFSEPSTRLFANDGSGRFTDRTEALGIDPASVSAFTATFADYDDDGWPDLFIAGDFCTSRLLRNDGGKRFVDVTDQAGVGTDENGMGQAVEDIDGDGRLDWVISGISHPAEVGDCPPEAPTIGCSGNRVYINSGDGTFEDATDRYGMRDAFWGWGVVASDFTNSGRRDVAVASGWAQASLPSESYLSSSNAVHLRSAGSPSRFWFNDGADGTWPEVAEQAGFVARGNGKALISFDYDDDGRLDLLQVNTEVPPTLLRNETPTGRSHWLAIEVSDPGSSNTRAVGSRIQVTDSAGRHQISEIRAGESFQGGGPSIAHFGMGPASGPVTVTVRWPADGGTETFVVPDLDRRVTLRRGEGR